jgi:hypothetical protein
MRDGFSNFQFDDALQPNVHDATINGQDIDLQGFNMATLIYNVGEVSLPSDASYYAIRMQHTDASALGAGPSTYANVASIDIITSVSGAITSGIINTFSASTAGSQAYKVGYKGGKRYIRAVLEKVGTPSVIHVGVVAVLGEPANWPVTHPANQNT